LLVEDTRKLLKRAIAGRGYYALEKRLAVLAAGTELILIRVSQNPHDANAVAVHLADGAKLGFVPCVANKPTAKRLDDGQKLSAIVARKLVATRADDMPEDLVYTVVASGDPIIRLVHIPT
jgi:hypothetical protein